MLAAFVCCGTALGLESDKTSEHLPLKVDTLSHEDRLQWTKLADRLKRLEGKEKYADLLALAGASLEKFPTRCPSAALRRTQRMSI